MNQKNHNKPSYKPQSKAEAVVDCYVDKKQIELDPNGSWTGVTADKNYPVPTQDADDL